MAKLLRAVQKLFGSTAGAGQIAEFGSAAASGFTGGNTYSGAAVTPAEVQNLAAWLSGWFTAVDGQYNPAIEDVNAVDWLFSRQLAYLFQAGVPEWDAETTYYIGSIAQDANGTLYSSIQNTNLNHVLSDTSWWENISRTLVQQASTDFTVDKTSSLYKASGTHTATMPDATTCTGLEYVIVKVDAGTTTTIATVSAQTISGSASYTLTEQWSFVRLRSDGSNWLITGAG